MTKTPDSSKGSSAVPVTPGQAPGPVQKFYWLFDEILRLGVLLVLSGADFPISIQIPEMNNPNYPN